MPALENLNEFDNRFWYWRGASGRRYIHSIYTPGECPPLPGAIFIAVHRFADGRALAIRTGRFEDDWSYVEALLPDPACGLRRIDEIHVHLLAGSQQQADEILADIEAGLCQQRIDGGFSEPVAEKIECQPALFHSLRDGDSCLASV